MPYVQQLNKVNNTLSLVPSGSSVDLGSTQFIAQNIINTPIGSGLPVVISIDFATLYVPSGIYYLVSEVVSLATVSATAVVYWTGSSVKLGSISQNILGFNSISSSLDSTVSTTWTTSSTPVIVQVKMTIYQ